MTTTGGRWRDEVAAAVPRPLLVAAAGTACLLVLAAGVVFAAQALVRVAPVTLAVVAALILTALLAPLCRLLRRWRLPAALAAGVTLLVFLAVLVLPLVFVGQQVAEQFSDLGRQLGEGLQQVRRGVVEGPLPVGQAQWDALLRQARTGLLNAAPGLASGAAAAAETFGAAALALVLLFFFLKDGPQMWGSVARLAPPPRRRAVDAAARAGWAALTGYVRGTMVIASVDAVGIGLALVLLDVPLALPMAMLTFVAAFIPIVGATVAGTAAALVALVANGPTDALLVVAAVIAVQQAEGNLLEPLVMGRAVRLHPAVVLVAVAAGTVLAGVAGAIVAVPLTAATFRAVATFRRPEAAEPAAAPDAGLVGRS